MWRSFWRSIDRFSLQHFKQVIKELREIKVVDSHNRELVVDLLQSIVEIVTYGDRQDAQIFDCFMEYQVLAEFVRVLKISSWNSRIEAPLLQYLSIMIQNMDSEHAIYYCFSNDYVNSIIAHQYEFDGCDLAPYYVSFLRAVSNKINKDTLCLLVKVQGGVVVSFPLYSEALKFAQHGEKMIQTAVRALTLNIYNVSDGMLYQFITTPPVSKYFSDLVYGLKESCVHLDGLVHATEEMCTNQRRKELLLETDKIVDDLYYFKDILCVGEARLSKVVTQNVLNLLVYPMLLPLLQLRQSDVSNISAITSFYIVSHLLQIVGGKNIVNSVAGVILYPYKSLRERDASEEGPGSSLFSSTDMEKLLCSGSESEGAENINGNPLHGDLPECISCNSHFINCPVDDNLCPERSGILSNVPRSGILSLILSDNQCLLLASLFLLLTLAESNDLEYLLASMIRLSVMQHGMILNALLKVLVSEPPITVRIQWHTGWFLRRLLAFEGMKLDDHNLHLFKTSYEQSRKHFQKELDGGWFDHILDTLSNEWASCKTALEEPTQSKDPLFLLELAVLQQFTDGDVASSSVAWQRMVDAVKVFILHLQLRAFICKGELLEKPLLDSMDSPAVDAGRTHASDLSSASFGSDVSVGSGIPCRIAFSNAGIRDIYLIPAARGTFGKLLLVEKHPFRSQRGVVIAIAPLAGLSPKIDEDQPTWLHLKIREFDPRLNTSKTRGYYPEVSNHAPDGRWTLGFPDAKASEAARLVILEETSKQRSSIVSALDPLLQNNYLGDNSDGQAE